MYYTNEMKITMKNENATATALEVLKARMIPGFGCDSQYSKSPSELMLENIFVEASAIVLPEGFGCLVPEDADGVQIELLKYLAENLHEDFFCEIYNYSDYSEGSVTAEFAGDTLKIKTVFYPCGYCETLSCDECGEDVIALEDYEEGKIYICPECGEEIDLSEDYEGHKPEITETVIKVK